MNIGFLVNTCEPFYRGGYEQRVATLARACVRKGHRVRIFTSCPEDQVIDGVEYVRIAPVRPFFNARGVRNVWADVLFLMHFTSVFFTWQRREMEVLDVCATPFVHLPWVALICWWKRIPVVATCMEALLASLDDYVAERGHGVFAGFSVGLFGAIYRFGMGSIRHRIAISEKTRLSLIQEGFPVEEIIEPGLEPNYFDSPEPGCAVYLENRARFAKVRFIFCGRLTPIKNVSASIEALAFLRNIQSDFEFHIVGTGSEEARLKILVETLHASDWVTFHGQVSEQTKLSLLQSADAFILSSPREGFSVATLEAMANGCLPVVINNPERPNGALDFVKHNENGVVGDAAPIGLREALQQVLLLSSEQRIAFRRAAWSAARHYQIDSRAEVFISYVSKVCSRG